MSEKPQLGVEERSGVESLKNFVSMPLDCKKALPLSIKIHPILDKHSVP